jgi:hypothetical protein
MSWTPFKPPNLEPKFPNRRKRLPSQISPKRSYEWRRESQPAFARRIAPEALWGSKNLFVFKTPLASKILSAGNGKTGTIMAKNPDTPRDTRNQGGDSPHLVWKKFARPVETRLASKT